MGDQPVVRPLPARRTKQTQNKRTQTSMSQVGFDPTIPVFERAKTVHVLQVRPRGHRDCKMPPFRIILSQWKQINALRLYFFNIYFSIVRPFTPRSPK
jgi:hypothetical protein